MGGTIEQYETHYHFNILAVDYSSIAVRLLIYCYKSIKNVLDEVLCPK